MTLAAVIIGAWALCILGVVVAAIYSDIDEEHR